MENIQVIIKRLIFSASSNNYAVYAGVLDDSSKKQVTLTGHMPSLRMDQTYQVQGSYVHHPKYGLQFSVTAIQQALPQAVDQLVAFLTSPSFKGIGPKTARRLIDFYGTDLLEKMKQEDFLFTDDFLTFKQKKALIQGFQDMDQETDTLAYLQSLGLSLKVALRVLDYYGDQVRSVVSNKPYRLLTDLPGIGLKTCDKIAAHLGLDPTSSDRVQAYLQAGLIHLSMKSGSTCITKERLLAWGQRQGFDIFLLEENLSTCLDQATIIEAFDDYYHPSQWEAERDIAYFFQNFPRKHLPTAKGDLDKILSAHQKQLGLQYDASQLEAIDLFFQKDKVLITGGPGTGKTTLVAGILSLFKVSYPTAKIAICAPTGRAAKRLQTIVNEEVTTLHSLLEWDMDANTFGRNQNHPLDLDLLVVDEISMVDNYVMGALVRAIEGVSKILLIGDKDQLPSVGPGFLIRDFIQSGLFDVAYLTHNYRQEAGSQIISLAQGVNQGLFDPTLCYGDVVYYDQEVDYGLLDRVIHDALTRGYSLDDIQVLASRYDGPLGIDSINNYLQARLNPKKGGKKELRHGYRIFRLFDRVLQLKNQPDDFVFNGDMGRIVEITYKDESESNKDEVMVDFDGTLVAYDRDQLINLKHAYCISVHKAQGSEFPVVILVTSKDQAFMLSRRLLYTGLSRAKNQLYLLGSLDLFEEGAKKDISHDVKTHLVDLFQEES